MAAYNGSKRSKIFVGMPKTYQRLKILTNHWVDSWYVSDNNDIFIVTSDANHNSSSINENEKLWKISERIEYTNVCCERSIIFTKILFGFTFGNIQRN